MPMQRKHNDKHDPVVAVGEVNGETVQVLAVPFTKDKFMWRIIRNGGQSVTSGMIKYDTVQAAFEAAIAVIIPDAEPVQFNEPTPEDYQALNALLFGFKKGEPLTQFHECVTAHRFLSEALATLKQAAERLPFDYDLVAQAVAHPFDLEDEVLNKVLSLKELAVQSQQVMIELCERDLETLGVFIAHHLIL